MGYITKLKDADFIEFYCNAIQANDVAALSKCAVALNAFLQEPKKIVNERLQAIEKRIQAVGVSTDFAQLTTDAFNVTVETDNFDLGYEKVFKLVQLSKGKDFWQIYNVENGLTFRKVEEGHRLQIDELSGEKVTAYVDYYGGALGWTDKMMRYREVPAMLDMAQLFRNKFYINKANNHYALLAAAAAGNITAYQGAGTDGQLQRDIQTINQACFTLANRCKDKGFGDTAAMTFVVYANPLDKARINAARRAITANVAPAGITGVQIDWNIEVIYTFNSSISSGSPLLILPYNKIQRAEDMPPTTYIKPKDPLTLNEYQAVWAIYGAIVADTDQCQTITLG